MKRLLSLIVMIVMTMSFFQTSAQTSATGFGINTFCQPLSKSPAYEIGCCGIPRAVFKKMQTLKESEDIQSALLKIGFTCTSKKNNYNEETDSYEYCEETDSYEPFEKATYTKNVSAGKIDVLLYNGDVDITFPNAAEKNKFLTTIKAEQAKGYIYTSTRYYWVGVQIEKEGNTVRLLYLGE